MAFTRILIRKNVLEETGESVTSPVQILILALFFQLLVFFLLLNSISEFSKKARDVLDSLHTSLGADLVVPDVRRLSIFPENKNSVGKGTSLTSVTDQFEHEIPGLGDTQIRSNGMLELNIPINLWNKMIGVLPGDEVDPALIRLMHFVTTHQNPSYRVVIQKNSRPEIFGLNKPVSAENTDYIVRVAQTMTTKFPNVNNNISYGIGPGTPGSISIRIIPSGPSPIEEKP